jgi:hypothetical protein
MAKKQRGKKITVLHYVEFTNDVGTVPKEGEFYLTNEGGKKYLVEVWR